MNEWEIIWMVLPATGISTMVITHKVLADDYKEAITESEERIQSSFKNGAKIGLTSLRIVPAEIYKRV
jgi:hypothetical protein